MRLIDLQQRVADEQHSAIDQAGSNIIMKGSDKDNGHTFATNAAPTNTAAATVAAATIATVTNPATAAADLCQGNDCNARISRSHYRSPKQQ